jgi:biotin-dependent carboxylase-like uncharacterized protein
LLIGKRAVEVFKIIAPGPMTTIQDLGRFSFMDRGVPPSGCLDTYSCRIANILVGNQEGCAVLEMTFLGATIEVLCEADIALAGASMAMTLNGLALQGWCSHRVRAGDLLVIGKAAKGCRGYLAVTGGVDVPPVMGSRSTFVRARIGGIEGRALIKGDILSRGPGDLLRRPRMLPSDHIPSYPSEILLKAIVGPQDEAFSGSMSTLFSSVYEVTPQSDRMGCRLKGPPLRHDPEAPRSIITEPVVPGNIQVPEDGLPIILLVEQTSGGYSKIATVITTDIAKVAQALPGNRVMFERVDLAEAHALYRQRERTLHRIRETI